MSSRKAWLILLIFINLVLAVIAILLAYNLLHQRVPAQELPTLVMFPTLTAIRTASPTATSSHTPTSTRTDMPTDTPLPTVTYTPTSTPTLSVRLLDITAIMRGVYVEPTGTAFPSGIHLLPAPPVPIEPLADATESSPPFIGWYSFQSDYPGVQYHPVHWTARQILEASEGQYHRYEGTGVASFRFEGEGLRIRYVAARNMGIFEIVVDGQVIDRVDAYNTELIFPGTTVYFVGSGDHLLQIRATGQGNDLSEGITVGLDAIQVYRADENTLIIPPVIEDDTPVATAQPARSIELLQAPPTVMPSATPRAPAEITVSVVIAYDENGNSEVDPAEGVSGIPVRAVRADNNRVIAQGLTDAQGHTLLHILAPSEVRIVVPYFGEVWTMPASTGSDRLTFTLLLDPGNQPGIIP